MRRTSVLGVVGAVADVFMSYSRRDREAVVRIVEALRARGKTVWVDLDDIIPSSKWMAEIRIAIAGCDTVIAAISPDSVASPVCQEEVGIALGLPKRLVPIVVRETPAGTVPPAVAELSYLFFTPLPGEAALDEQRFQAAVDRLVEVLETDIEAVHTHSEILRRALRWEEKGEDKSQLLRGRELEEAEQWQVAQSGRKPPVTPLQRQLILASRRASTRRQRSWFSAVSVLVVVMALLTGVALVQRHTAQVQRHAAQVAEAVAVRQRDAALSGELASESSSVLTADPQLGLILALDAYKDSPTDQAQTAVRQAVARSAVRAVWPSEKQHNREVFTGQVLSPGAFDPSGRYIVAIKDNNLVQVWARAKGRGPGAASRPYTLGPVPVRGFRAQEATFNPQGNLVLVLGTAGAEDAGGKTRWVLLGWDWRRSPRATVLSTLLLAYADDPFGPVLSPNGAYLAFRRATKVVVEATAGQGRPISRPGPGVPIAVSNDGRLLASSAQAPTAKATAAVTVVSVLDMATGRSLLVKRVAVQVNLATTAAFSADDSRLALGGLEVEVLDLKNPAAEPVVYPLSLPPGLSAHCCDVNAVGSLAWSPVSDVLAVGTTDDYVRIWASGGGTPIFLASQESAWAGVAFSPDGQYLASGAFGDGTVQVWQWLAASSPVLPVNAMGVLASPDGTEAAVATEDGRALLWDWATQAVRVLAPGVPLAFSNDGQYLVVDEVAANRMAVFDVRSGALQAAMALPADSSTAGTYQAMFSADGRSVALLVFREELSGQPFANLAVWPWASGAGPVYWKGYTDQQASLVSYGPGRVSFIAGTDLYRWDGNKQDNAQLVHKDIAPSMELGQVALLPGGRLVLESYASGQAKEVDLSTGKREAVLAGYAAQDVSTGNFSLDRAGNLVAFSGENGYVAVWDLKKPDAPVIVTSLSSEADLSFDAEGNVLMAASQDGVHVLFCQYCGPFPGVLRLAHERVVRALSPAERAEFLHEKVKGGQSATSVVQAPVIAEALASVPFHVGDRLPTTPSGALVSAVPQQLSNSCQVQPDPGFSAEALVDCGADARLRLPSGVPLTELNYLLFPSPAALASAYRSFLSEVAGRGETGASCGHDALMVLVHGECAYRFPGGPKGRVVEFTRKEETGSPPDLAWTVDQPGRPLMLIDATAPLGGDSDAVMATWWAAGPAGWLASPQG